MVSIIKSAKSITEAIRLGCEELKCERSDVDVEVLDMGSNGIFGLFGKPAKVKLTKKDDDKDFSFEMPKLTLDPQNDTKKQKAKAEAPKAKQQKAKQPKQPKQPKENREPKPAKEPRAPKEKAEEVKKAPVEPIDEPEFVATPEEDLTDDAKKARDFLKGTCERMGVNATFEIMEAPEQLRIKLAGEEMSVLIGRRGETLDSIQYLTSLCVNRGREKYLRITLDAENYRAKREEALRKLAVRMANKAKKSGKRVALEPMNPYERRILHSALQDDEMVSTHSEGEEPYRRVIITVK